MDEPSFEDYNDSGWVEDMGYCQSAVLQLARTAEEEANE
jgi:hypothetical protein